MLHARGQSTAVSQQQHVDCTATPYTQLLLAWPTPTVPRRGGTVTSTSWWWGQEQRVVLNFGGADTTPKATGAISAQIDFVCVLCTSSSTAAVASLSLSLSLCLCSRVPHTTISPFLYLPFYVFAATTKCLYKRHLFPTTSAQIDFVFVLCVCFLPIHSGHQVRWTYQPGSHRRKVTQDFSSTFFLRCVPSFFSREGFSHSFPSSTVKSNFVY